MEDRVLDPAARRGDAGFTLIEVLISMVILGIILVGFQAALTQRLVGDLQVQDARNAGVQLAADRIRVVQMDPVYNELSTRYAANETSIPNYSGYTRLTTLVQTTTNGNDYTTVTVKVSSPRLKQPIYRSVTIAAP